VFEEERAAILAAGCDDLVHKPLQEETIFERMAHHLGVTYQYAEALQEATAPVNLMDQPALEPDHFSVMSQDWITAMYQAALQVDGAAILQLVEQIPTSHPLLATQLKDLTHRFCFDEIMELTQQSLY
jgi:hypothetical protein